MPDERHVDSLWAAINDLQNTLSMGSSLVISYRSRFALPLIACLHIFNGKNADDAIAAVSNITNNSSIIFQFRPLLESFREYVSHPVEDARKVRDAIQIDRAGMIQN